MYLSYCHLDSGSVKALYKSDMTFSERLYVSLDVDLCRIRLHDCLTNITRKPLLYVRDIVPRACFEGLTRLDKVSRDFQGALYLSHSVNLKTVKFAWFLVDETFQRNNSKI